MSKLSNDIFGSENFVNKIALKTKVAGVSGSHHGKSLKNSVEYLLLHSKDQDGFKISGNVYDKTELMDFISEMEDEGKSWKYVQVMVDEGYKKESCKFKDGYGDEITLYEHVGYKFESINSIAKKEFNGNLKEAYYSYVDKIFDTTNAQSSIRQRVIENSVGIESDLISIKYIPRSGRNQGRTTTLYYKAPSRRLFTWLKDTVEIEDEIFKKINAGNLWTDIQYNNVAREGDVSFPNGKKPIGLIQKAFGLVLNNKDYCLDYFAGSGTTGHAVINLNRGDDGKRKYILIEMGNHFDTVLKPRLAKVAYAIEWKNGKPVARDTGISHCFKYIRLESYEDTLGNLRLEQKADLFSNSSNDEARQAYVMNYMLDVETRGSQSLLNIQQFLDPTQYELNVRSASGDETVPVKVDLLETFNYLLGLEVEHIAAPIYFDAEISQGEFGRWQAEVKQNKNGKWWFRTVYGKNRNGQMVLVVWRNLPSVIANAENGLQHDNAVLDAVLVKRLKIRLTESLDDEIDVLYVNGDHNINIPRNRRDEPMQQARVQLIEEAFQRLMFADTEAVL